MQSHDHIAKISKFPAIPDQHIFVQTLPFVQSQFVCASFALADLLFCSSLRCVTEDENYRRKIAKKTENSKDGLILLFE
jgi:hypothetical protein